MKRQRTAAGPHRPAERKGGSSLAKGPVAIVGLLLLAFGVLALIFGDANFEAAPIDGDVDGEPFLGILGNGWTNLLFAAAGALLLLGAPLHWGAKGLSLIVGLVLGAASSIALWYGDDVFGIFAADGPTTLAWGAPAAILLALALLPRTRGRARKEGTRGRGRKEGTPRGPRRKKVVEERPAATDHVRDDHRGRDEERLRRDEGRPGPDEERGREQERHLGADEEERIRRDERERMGGGDPRS
ncbi:MAG: hypothetical protein MSC31_10395 [Solirubrobacteraceae bacterium MAG38_C4-C5]|nr:hypothetical protein [Candidatus Siliceabacter maunaloa]